MNWFTADTHAFHANIIKHCHRPFDSVEEMNETLIDHINERVGENDTLYHLGDFSFGPRRSIEIQMERAVEFRKAIKCKRIVLIEGNHDHLTPVPQFRRLFDRIHPMLQIHDTTTNQKIVLCHFAMRVWNASHYGRWHLYGHSHGRLEEQEFSQNSFSFDVGVDCHDFYPINSNEVAEEMQRRREAGVTAPCQTD